MKKHKLLVILIAVLVVAGIFLAFAGNNVQGLIFKFKKTDYAKIINFKPDYSKIVTPSLHNPIPPQYPRNNEQEITPVTLVDGNLSVIVPEGYEPLGKKHLEDLKNCWNIIPKFLGITPYWNGAIIKIFVKKTDSGPPGAYLGNGLILYPKTKKQIDTELNMVLNNDPGGFLYKSSPNYCANTHEFTHLVVDTHPIPLWANEGIVQYSQKFNQAGSEDYFTCQQDGVFQKDFWVDDKLKLFPYSNLSIKYDFNSEGSATAIWHNSAMCFWELFDNQFGADKRNLVFAELGKTPYLAVGPGGTGIDTSFFINKLLFKYVDKIDDLQKLLAKFGFIKGTNY